MSGRYRQCVDGCLAPTNVVVAQPWLLSRRYALTAVRLYDRSTSSAAAAPFCISRFRRPATIRDVGSTDISNVNGGLLNFLNHQHHHRQCRHQQQRRHVIRKSYHFPVFNQSAPSAGSATIINSAGGALVFASNSNAGTAQNPNQARRAAIFMAEQSSAATARS